MLKNTPGAINVAVGNFVSANNPMIAAAQGLGGSHLIRILQHNSDTKALDIVGTLQGLTRAAVHTNSSGGLSVAAGDIDKDGLDELIVGQMNGDKAQYYIQILNLYLDAAADTVKILGQPTSPVHALPPNLKVEGGVNLAVGDVDGDGDNEIVAVTAGNTTEGGGFIQVIELALNEKPNKINTKIDKVERFGTYQQAFGTAKNPSGGLSVTVGNVDTDIADEIIVGTQAIVTVDVDGSVKVTNTAAQSYAKVYDYDGETGTFSAPKPLFKAFLDEYNPTSGAVNLGFVPME